MLFKDIPYLELWQPFYSAEREQFCEIILNLSQWFKRFLYLEIRRPSCSVEQNYLCNFERGHHRQHTCEVI